ncbi:GNAT family N-acetyltransferase [Candidatus Dojkabacteria bacterium]|nr:GNAT family N-acetyltransferase [Candidatus Dojkabacteria bacterium]
MEVKKIKKEDITKEFMAKLKLAFPIEEENPNWNFNKTKQFVSNDKNILLIGYMLGNMAGFLFGHTLDRFDNQKQFFIYELYTSKAYRREKVMSSILNFLLEMLKKEKFTSAWVLSNRSNKSAVAFYTNTSGSIPNGDDILFEYKL